MNILFISPSFPTRLHRIRAWQLLETLSRNNEVHLVTFAWENVPAAEYDELRKKCASVTVVRESKWAGRVRAVLGLFTSLPIEVSYCRSPRMQVAVTSVLAKEKIDLIYVKRLRSAQFAMGIDLPVVLDSTDAMSMFYSRAATNASSFRQLPQKIFYMLEGARYARYEKKLSQQFKKWIVCSLVDAAYLQKEIPSAKVLVVPNGVDTTYFSKTTEPYVPHTLIVSGLLNKFVNYEAAEYFVREIFPLILREVPDARLLLVGPAGKRIQKLASEHITVTGYVPDLRPYIAQAQVVCCPVLTGAGTRNKILQAWAIGRPVVSTPQGAEGLDVADGDDILLGSTPEAFAQNVLHLLASTDISNKLVEGGYAKIQKWYAMDAIADALQNILISSSSHDHPSTLHPAAHIAPITEIAHDTTPARS